MYKCKIGFTVSSKIFSKPSGETRQCTIRPSTHANCMVNGSYTFVNIFFPLTLKMSFFCICLFFIASYLSSFAVEHLFVAIELNVTHKTIHVMRGICMHSWTRFPSISSSSSSSISIRVRVCGHLWKRWQSKIQAEPQWNFARWNAAMPMKWMCINKKPVRNWKMRKRDGNGSTPKIQLKVNLFHNFPHSNHFHAILLAKLI